MMSGRVDVDELRDKVKGMYKAVAEEPHGTFHFEMGRALAERLGYPAGELDQIPAEAIESFAGVGYHLGLARDRRRRARSWISGAARGRTRSWPGATQGRAARWSAST